MMSTGLPCDHTLGNTSFSALMVSSLSLLSSIPRSVARSAAITPGPPPLVMITRRSDATRYCERDSTLAAANSWETLCTRNTPERESAAEKVSSLPTSAPVCDMDASAPAACLPTFSAMTGLIRAAARRLLINLRESDMPSIYRRILFVRGSETR